MLIKRTKKFRPQSEIAVMRLERRGETSPLKVNNGLMNVNKLNKEVPRLPFPTISMSGGLPSLPGELERAHTRLEHMLFTLLIFRPRMNKRPNPVSHLHILLLAFPTR